MNPDTLVGTSVGHFKITQHISRGGMADVYLARDERLERRVALKIMLPVLAADEAFAERFRREAQTAAQLDHPNIVQVYEIGWTPNQLPYIAMQYIDGQSLQQVIQAAEARGQPFPPSYALSVIAAVANALEVAHQARIVHRDVKPSNILLRQDGTPVVVDLGIAAVEGGVKLTHTGTLIGTPHYMSPEQASGNRVDRRSDIYSLGVILFEMLAGRPPFVAQDKLAIMHKHVYEPPPSLRELRPSLSPAIVAIVERCLQKDPANRYQTAAELRQALEQAMRVDGGTERTTIEPPFPVPAPTSQRPRWAIAVVALVVIALFAAVGFFIWRNVSPTSAGTDEPTPVATIMTELPDEQTEVGFTTPATEEVPGGGVDEEPTLTPTLPPPTEVASPTPEEATATATTEPTATPFSQTVEIGRSVQGRPIQAVSFGHGPNHLIFIGGLHAGYAPGTVAVALRAIDHFTSNPQQLPESVTLHIIPNASPDSPNAPGQLRGRLNANGVDLNRNWDCRWIRDALFRNEVVPGSGGPSPFSEPETQALSNFILEKQAVGVVFWEARASNGLSTPGACDGPSLVSNPLARTYGNAAGYVVEDFEDLTSQVLNGDGSNWLDQVGIPAIAVLLPDYDDVDWNNSLAGMLAVLNEH